MEQSELPEVTSGSQSLETQSIRVSRAAPRDLQEKETASGAQSCLTLCDPMDGSPPGSSVHGISQAKILEWVASPFSRGYS